MIAVPSRGLARILFGSVTLTQAQTVLRSDSSATAWPAIRIVRLLMSMSGSVAPEANSKYPLARAGQVLSEPRILTYAIALRPD